MLRHIFSTFLVFLTAVLLSGCSGADLSSPTQTTPPALPLPGVPAATSSKTTTPAAAPDYQRLLLQAGDLTDDEDTFHEQSKQSGVGGKDGASVFFVNDKDNRAISDAVIIYPDAATAGATLKQASATLPTLVADGTPQPIAVGTDGVVVKGTYPDQAKAVTVLFFTEGRALVRLEFQSAANDPTTDRFVTSVGKMQDIALRLGLDDPR